MAMPALPEGFWFRVQAFDASRSPGTSVTGLRAAVVLTIESEAGAAATQTLDASQVKTEAQLVSLVEAAAVPMAHDFTLNRNLQTWVDANWPA